MKLFQCPYCQLMLFFENSHCSGCTRTLGFAPEANELYVLEPIDNDLWQVMTASGAKTFKFCSNIQYASCNWLIGADSADSFCMACRHNQTVPDLSNHKNLQDWQKLEHAKHRLFYSLLRLNLRCLTRAQDSRCGLAFDFLADTAGEKEKILTGHDDGIITISLAEADDSEREKRRLMMHEPYRTLLGHFRHEIGHYYWDRLVDEGGKTEECRALFGDDRIDYEDALKKHYNDGAPQGWQQSFVSSYATSHPWEDFAETWAHYMHIIDSLETAGAFGVSVNPLLAAKVELRAQIAVDPYTASEFDPLVRTWIPLTYAMNSMNRSMGLKDIYPFVLSEEVIRKLDFIHRLVHNENAQAAQNAA